MYEESPFAVWVRFGVWAILALIAFVALIVFAGAPSILLLGWAFGAVVGATTVLLRRRR